MQEKLDQTALTAFTAEPFADPTNKVIVSPVDHAFILTESDKQRIASICNQEAIMKILTVMYTICLGIPSFRAILLSVLCTFLRITPSV